MAYKMKKVSTGSFGSWLVGKVQISKERKQARLVPIDEDSGEENEDQALKFKLSDCPENLIPGKFVVQLNEEKDAIANFRPYSGEFLVKFTHFAGKKDEPPAPQTRKSTRTGHEYLNFTALNEIQEGQMKGIELPYTLYYNFMEADEEGNSVVAIKGTGKSSEAIEEYLTTIGSLDFGAIPFKDNILPALQKRALKADKQFKVIVKKGWIVAVLPLEETSTSKKSTAKKSNGDDSPPWKEEPDKE